MASTRDELEEAIREAVTAGFRGRLLDRGLARSMIWVDGELPEGAPEFSDRLSYDLLAYAYTLLSYGLRLRDLEGDPVLCSAAFEKSATALNDVISKGDPDDPEKGFHRILAAASYHLGHFSAKAYSTLSGVVEQENLSPMERMLALLMLRDFDALEKSIMEWKLSKSGDDEALSEIIEENIEEVLGADVYQDNRENYGFSSVEEDVVDLAITDNYLSSLFEYLLALETGSARLVDNSVSRIDVCLSVAGELNLLPQWWVIRITRHLLLDLWRSSFHTIVPVIPDDQYGQNWQLLRWMFIASLLKRSKAEIELWPSQIAGAKRAINDHDNLVVSLPTSAGKTRIAELCILRCLAIGKRVLFITPLRALSAQTESSLRKTFIPLGNTVSSLYGSAGTSDFDKDVIRENDIVVGTPEKLDFALRNDPALIDDVGLVVLDEGHMIGLNEREINYEVQIQRLLRRSDADQRRIVCLSAILPDGEQLDDFVGWLTGDQDDGEIQSDWRPTDLRYGEVVWRAGSGRINFIVGDEQSFVPGYIQPLVPSHPNPGVRTTSFPNNAKELTLSAAWRLVEDGHTVLIYCPQRNSVEGFARDIMDLHRRGALCSVLSVPMERLELAKVLGAEWLGEEHPIVECLDIGVAIHHGTLPTPFRKEMETLLQDGVLKITVSSPTLAQGLNLSATTVIVHSLYRSGKIIEASEFKNVVGRAGRAYVDSNGLVLHPIFDRHDWRKGKWRSLVMDENMRNMESGMVRLVLSLLLRMKRMLGVNSSEPLLDYVMNNVSVWTFPEVNGESAEHTEEEKNSWNKHLVFLDTAILSLLGKEDIAIDEIPETLDTIMQSSLWQRRLGRHDDDIKELFDSVLAQRGRHIWNMTTPPQRKGYFYAGVGLETGLQLDQISAQGNDLLISANWYILEGEIQSAIAAIIELAELLFVIPPFKPSTLPNNWRGLLTSWLKGELVAGGDPDDVDDVLKFVEDGLVYRLPWGIEAIRVRAEANGDVIADGTTIDDYDLSALVPAIENGTLNRSSAILMQAGFNSRQAAIIAVESTGADFTNTRQLKAWLRSEQIFKLTLNMNWPTPETAGLWWDFAMKFVPSSNILWKTENYTLHVSWSSGGLQQGQYVKLWNDIGGDTIVLGSSGDRVGVLDGRYRLEQSGIYHSVVAANQQYIDVNYWGSGENILAIE